MMPSGGSYFTCMNCKHKWQGSMGQCPLCGFAGKPPIMK